MCLAIIQGVCPLKVLPQFFTVAVPSNVLPNHFFIYGAEAFEKQFVAQSLDQQIETAMKF